ncbi:MAG: glycosyltransferase 87 family protein, partial [Microbacteriaceae bacterium]
ITLPALFGASLYLALWFLGIVALNAVATWLLVRAARPTGSMRAAWWWMLTLLLLSPVALLRLEGVTAPLVVIALTLISRRPIVASVILTAATWIKVWPAAVLFAAVGALARRKTIIAAAAIFSAGVVGAVWALGGLAYIGGFISVQGDRALQLEAPVSTPWLWMAITHSRGSYIYQNEVTVTREVTGPGDGAAIAIMIPLLAIAVVAIMALIVWARRRGAEPERLLLVGSLAIATACIVFNKVASPQYMLWLTPIVAIGLLSSWQRWRTPAVLLAVISLLTTLVFPVLYLALVALNPFVAALLTLRNALLVAVLIWCVRELVRANGNRPQAV